MRASVERETSSRNASAREDIREFLRRKIFSRIQRKLIAAFLVVVLLPLLGTALYGNWVTSRVLGERAVDEALADLQQRASRIEGYLAGVRGDVLYLSQINTLASLIDARARGDPAAIVRWRGRLAGEFYVFAQTHPMYYQVRYITEDGWEFVRVNASYGAVQVVPLDQLQDKSNRYYFTQTIGLSRSEVYVSPLDLNREFGRIETPYTPVIRYATPVFYADGRRAGIVIMNLYAEEFLRYASEGAEGHELALVDQDGYYLVHPDPAREWGRPWDLGTGYRLQADFPQHWRNILSDQTGTEPGDQNVVVHVPVYPPGRRDGSHWVLLHMEPKSELFASVRAFRFSAVGILVLAVLGAVTMAVFLARSITAPVLALTERVKRLGKGETNTPVAISSQDEIGELAAAFDEMAEALKTNLDRLFLLNRSGQRIAAQLERSEVLTAIMQAAEELFEADYCVIRLIDEDNAEGTCAVTSGDEKWAPHAETVGARTTRHAALTSGNWQATLLTPDDGPAGIVCCAPLSTGARRQGLIELYGHQPDLADPATGNLLATLAIQSSIALENARLYGTLAEHRAQLQTLVERLIAAQEEERRMVAYDIHDGLIQRLVAARLHLVNFVAQRNQGLADTEVSLEKGLTQLATAISEARRVIEGLRPATLDDLGLVPTLEQYARELGAEAGWEVTIEAHPQQLRLPPAVEITAFRIAQEALTNSRKHADANSVVVGLDARDGRLVVEVRDSGRGFDPDCVDRSGHCMGLISMQERARVLGGECIIESGPEKGTVVRAMLPFRVDGQGDGG